MSVPTQKTKTEHKKRVPEKDRKIVTLSAQASVDLIDIFDTLQSVAKADRATLMRFAVRNLIKTRYQGNGKWVFGDDDKLDLMASRNAHDCGYGIAK